MVKSKKTQDKYLKQVYFNPKETGSLGGIKNLKTSLKLKKKQYKTKTIINWLQAQDAYTLHKPIRRKFKRRSTIVSGLNDQFQGDLIDVRNIKTHNNGYSYILSVVDVFSKYGWMRPLKTKHGKEVASKLNEIFQEKHCRAFQTDKGKEFYNSHVKGILNSNNVTHFSTENDDIKAACVERFNRTIKTKLYRWFTKTNSYCWVDVLDDLLHSYNHTQHTSIGIAPANVNNKNEEDVWLILHSHLGTPTQTPRFKVGDHVRISKYKHVFSKGYDANWSTEVFNIDKVLQTDPPTYKLLDALNEKIYGSYYENELQKIIPKNKFIIEKIIAERKHGKKVQYYVKYKGYPDKFNTWIDKSDVMKV